MQKNPGKGFGPSFFIFHNQFHNTLDSLMNNNKSHSGVIHTSAEVYS